VKNKEELFNFLSVNIVAYKFPDDKEQYVTDGPLVLTDSITRPMAIQKQIFVHGTFLP